MEIIYKYKLSIQNNAPIVSTGIDRKILRLKSISLLKNGSLKKKHVYNILFSSIPFIGLSSLVYFGKNVFHTLMRKIK